MPINIEELANHAVFLRDKRGLTVPNAVWAVLRARGLAERSDARDVATAVLSHLQRRSTAKRMKNRRSGKRSPRVSEQLDFKPFRSKQYEKDALAVIAERGGDPQ